MNERITPGGTGHEDRRAALPVLAGLFLCSGAAALIYQVAWLRMLALVFGVTVYAASAVLSSFMGGLALGSWVGGRVADRSGAPLRLFAVLEVGIVASALGVPFALEAVSELYASIYAANPEALGALTLARFLGSGIILLVPTTLMGASLPLLARHVTRTGGSPSARIGWLYAANTAGGILGAGLAGFVLIGAIGVTASTAVAAVLNVTAGVGAVVLGLALGTPRNQRDVVADSTPVPDGPGVVLLVVALAGFAGLALEVVWFRLLTHFLTATTYAFTTMLATVLLGLALGAAIASWRVSRSPDLVRSLARIQIWTGILVLVSMTALAETYRMGWRTSGMIQACVVALLPSTILMGATFPYAVALWMGGLREEVGRRIGQLYAVNVCGAVAGSLAGGLVLLPWLGARASLLVLAAVYVAAGVLVAASLSDRRRALGTTMAGAVLFVGAALLLPDIYGLAALRRHGDEQLVFRAEGVQTTAVVHRQPTGNTVLYLDGLHQANDTSAMVRVHAEIGHLPMALHPAPRQALVVGIGGGVTAGAVAAHEETTVEVVELAESVVRAVPYFAHVNGDLLERPNVRIRVDDGRNFLRFTPMRFDVITADIIQPIHAGAGNLYSLEYFQLARRVLNEGGLMMQWIGQREEAHYKLIMRTFLAAFPHATLWSGGSLMVGSVTPLELDQAAFERQRATPGAAAGFDSVGLVSFQALLERYTAGPEEMRRFCGEGPVLTDDHPLLEFHRSLPGGSPPVDVSSMRGDVTRHVRR